NPQRAEAADTEGFCMLLRYLRAATAALLLITAGCATTGPDQSERPSGPPKDPGAPSGPVTSAPASGGKGGAAGAAVSGGSYQDRQEAELRQQLDGSGVR